MRHIGKQLVAELLDKARTDNRKRAFHVFHKEDDAFNRMLVAGVNGSYAAPHRHTAKFEVFTYVAGDLIVLEFHDDGTIKNAYDLSKCPYVEVEPMTWHAVIFLSDEWAFMEMALWPNKYDPSDKEFAPWAPKELAASVPDYIAQLAADARPAMTQMSQ